MGNDHCVTIMLQSLAAAMRTAQAEGVSLPQKSFPSVDLKTMAPLNVEAEIRTAAIPVGIAPIRDSQMLPSLLLLYTCSASLLCFFLSDSPSKAKGDLFESWQAALGLLLHSARRMVDISSSRLARTGTAYTAAHIAARDWSELHTGLWEALGMNCEFVRIVSVGEEEDVHRAVGRVWRDGENTVEVVAAMIGSARHEEIPQELDARRIRTAGESEREQELRAKKAALEREINYKEENIVASTLEIATAEDSSADVIAGIQSLLQKIVAKKAKIALEVAEIDSELLSIYQRMATPPATYPVCQVTCQYRPSSSFVSYLRRGTYWYKLTSSDVSEVLFSEVQAVLSMSSPSLSPVLVAYASAAPTDFPPAPDCVNFLNHRFERDLQDYKDTELVLRINELYTRRMSAITALHHSYREASLSSPQSVLKFEIMNFPYFLKLKADENLSKWTVLDQCVREIDPLQRGLCDFDERSGFILKLKSQLFSTWKDVPRFLIISLYEKLQLERLLEAFLTSYRELTVALYVLSCVNSGHFMDAFQSISVILDPLPAEPSNYLKIIRDASKVLSLRLISLLSRLETDQIPAWVSVLMRLKALFVDPGDIHSRQICASAEFISKERQIELTDEVKVGGKFPQELEKSLDAIQETDCYAWMDLSAQSGMLAEEMKRMKDGALAPWVRMHVRLLTSKQLLPAGELERLS